MESWDITSDQLDLIGLTDFKEIKHDKRAIIIRLIFICFSLLPKSYQNDYHQVLEHELNESVVLIKMRTLKIYCMTIPELTY